jgi:hypothetical protein
MALTRTATVETGLPELLAPGQDVSQLTMPLRSAANAPAFPFTTALGRLTEAERKSGRLLAFEEAKLILVVDQFEELFTKAAISQTTTPRASGPPRPGRRSRSYAGMGAL